MCDERQHRRYAEREVKDALVRAVGHLVNRDAYLLQHALYEPAITHRLAVYLEYEFPTHDVDCEYDQNMGGPKAIPIYGNIRPDIMVHCRGFNHPWNLLAVEAKKRRASEEDRVKLRGLKCPHGDYRYLVVALLRLDERNARVDFGDEESWTVAPGVGPEQGRSERRLDH